MRLHYDYDAGCYVGEQYSVAEWTFLAALQALIMAGYEPEDALDHVLDEESWSEQTDGVTLLAPNPVCRCCGALLPRPRRCYCDALCEARHYVARLQQAR